MTVDDTAGHDTAGHDMAGHDMAGHDTDGHDMAGHDTAGDDMASSSSAYDLPWGMTYLRSQTWAGYVPFLPTFRRAWQM